MRQCDRAPFIEAAQHFQVWILVRGTKEASCKHIGKNGFWPKRLDCKAKTADIDVGGYLTAGLVVSYELHPTAFTSGKVSAAAEWEKFAPKWGIVGKTFLSSSIYTLDVDESSKYFGCVKCDNKYIHGDYDLYDIVLPDNPRRNLGVVDQRHGETIVRPPRFLEVERFVNDRIGVPVVQHPTDRLFRDQYEDPLEVFEPSGKDYSISAGDTESWYKSTFPNRKAHVLPR